MIVKRWQKMLDLASGCVTMFVVDWKGVAMIALDDLLLSMDRNMWIWVCVFLSVAVIALLLALRCRGSPRASRIGRWACIGVFSFVTGAILAVDGGQTAQV